MMQFCCFSQKKVSFILGVIHGAPIFAKVGPKNGNFWEFQQIFFRTTRFQLKLLQLIESLNIFHWKAAKKVKVGVILGENLGQIKPNDVKKVQKKALSIDFFPILQGEYLLKQKLVIVQTPEGKFNANIPRNATFEGYLESNFCLILVKNGKKTNYFQEFYFSQSVLKSQN